MTLNTKANNQSSQTESVFAGHLNHPWIKWGLIFALCSFFGLFVTSKIYFQIEDERLPSFGLLLCWQLIGYWYVWFFSIPLILWLKKRFPHEAYSWKRILLIHFSFFLLLVTIRSLWYVLIGIYIDPYHLNQQLTQKFWSWFYNNLTSQSQVEVFIYGLILGTSYAIDYYRRFREQEYQASQLKAQLAISQLEVLKMQLHPHFLFNSINGIVSLVRNQENKAAVKMLVGLSDLLRHTLQSADKQEVTLREELDFLTLYLDLEQMRFSDRLQIKMNIAPDTLQALVPNLILQPLVENSIRHGISQRNGSGLIEITGRIENETLIIKIRDDGPGLPENWQLEGHEGIGLANIRERLRQISGTEDGFQISNRKDGVEAVLNLPLKLKEPKKQDDQDD